MREKQCHLNIWLCVYAVSSTCSILFFNFRVLVLNTRCFAFLSLSLFAHTGDLRDREKRILQLQKTEMKNKGGHSGGHSMGKKC